MRAVDRVTTALAPRPGPTHSWLVGEPCFAPPPELVEAFVRAARSGSFRYPPHNGLPALREVLAARQAAEGQPLTADQVVVTSGAKSGLLAILSALLEPGDDLIHPVPCYPAYPVIATRLGARPVAVEESNGGFDGWPQAVADHIGPRTRAVIIASPSNPTGSTLDVEQARALVELCRDLGVRLICDEAYIDFRFAPDPRSIPAAYDPERTTVVQVQSASKSWAVCGWRVGWVAADAALASRVASVHASLVNPASGPAQEALSSLPAVPVSYLAAARTSVADRMTELCSILVRAGLAVDRPEGGFYLWLNVADQIRAHGVHNAVDWSVDVARKHGVGLWPAEDFGGTGHVRIAVTAPSDSEWPFSVNALAQVFTAAR
jgi:aminotransferase